MRRIKHNKNQISLAHVEEPKIVEKKKVEKIEKEIITGWKPPTKWLVVLRAGEIRDVRTNNTYEEAKETAKRMLRVGKYTEAWIIEKEVRKVGSKKEHI